MYYVINLSYLRWIGSVRKEMDLKNVKICPSVVEFYDAETHCVHQMKLTVQNFSKKSQHIKLCQPESEVSNDFFFSFFLTKNIIRH